MIIFAKTELKEWLGWDDTERRFSNTGNLDKFLSWIFHKKIDISPDTRDYLPQLFFDSEYNDILDAFEREESLSIHDCRSRIEERKPKPLPDISGLLIRLNRIKAEIDILPLPPIKRLGKTPEEKEQKKLVLNLLHELVEVLKLQIDFLSTK